MFFPVQWWAEGQKVVKWKQLGMACAQADGVFWLWETRRCWALGQFGQMLQM